MVIVIPPWPPIFVAYWPLGGRSLSSQQSQTTPAIRQKVAAATTASLPDINTRPLGGRSLGSQQSQTTPAIRQKVAAATTASLPDINTKIQTAAR
jgi:hypothetical protein